LFLIIANSVEPKQDINTQLVNLPDIDVQSSVILVIKINELNHNFDFSNWR